MGGGGFDWGRGWSIQPSGLTPLHQNKSSINGAPQNPTETDPRAREVTRTQHSAKNANGIFEISVSRGFGKAVICHVFVETNLTIFNAEENCSATLATERAHINRYYTILTD